MLDTDVLVVGSGVVGLSVALQLAQSASSLQIVVLDPVSTPVQIQYPQTDMRVIAINRSTQNYFKKLGVWQIFEAQPVGRFESMCVWDASLPTRDLVWNASSFGWPELGHMISLPYIQYVLSEHLKNYSNVERRAQQPIAWERDPSNVTLTTEEGRWRARVLMAADGGHSWVRRSFGFEWDEHPYPHNALTMVVRTQHPHQNVARQIFTAQGSLAFLPMSLPTHSTVVWSLPPAEALRLKQESLESCLAELTQAFEARLGRVEECLSERVTFELNYRHAKTYVQSRVALLGDAAHTVHPMAGLGGNLGLADAQVLGESILQAWNRQRDIGGWSALKRYQRHRRWHNGLYASFLQQVVRTFDDSTQQGSAFRRLGIQCASRLMPLRCGAGWAAEYFL